MLFNSYIFIFLFLPITLLIYFFLNKKRLTELSKAFLVLASLFFYSWWNASYLPLIIISMVVNYSVGSQISRLEKSLKVKKTIFLVGIVLNLALLGYFKYADFFISNINALFLSNLPLLKVALPLAISFFTFQQIAYLVDSYRGETKEYDFFNYALFVSFFPQLIAGPIVHHGEMMPQFEGLKNKVFNHKNVARGLFFLTIGLVKKTVIADSFALWANSGFDHATSLNMVEAWIASLTYTIQLYFDFSGYCDMAIGVALMFNIKLPINFNSPYKALNIQDFWRRWHMTLSRFLKDYLYIPLGGSRASELKTCRNLIITFLLGGIWHGAGWTFVIWGLLHGVALVIHRLFSKTKLKLNKFVAWFITFNFVNIAWVFFRATSFNDAFKVLKAMFGMGDIVLYHKLEPILGFLKPLGVTFEDVFVNIDAKTKTFTLTLLFLFVIALCHNTQQLVERIKFNRKSAVVLSILFVLAILHFSRISEFIYFNF